jgi:TPP-dependent pyruvate/acetoin dehydrogenase alpha subunit
MPPGNQLRSGTRARSEERTPVSAAVDSNNGASPMHAERLRRLYAAMLKCRIIDNLMPSDIKAHYACRQREAIIAGAAIHLKPGDFILPSSAELFARLVQGASAESVIASLREEINRDSSRPGIRVPAANPAIAQLQVGAGMALACKLQGKPSVTLCVVDEAVDQPDLWLDPVIFAARRKLAIVFVNLSRAHNVREQHAELHKQTQDVLPAIVVDGSDAVAVYRVAEECTRRARQGLGPSLIECIVESGRDPLPFMEDYLKQRSLWSETWKETLARQFGREAESVLKKYLGKAGPRARPVAALL